MKAAVYLSRPGIVCPLGATLEDVTARLFSADRSGLHQRHDLVAGRSVYCGVVAADLPPIPEHLSRYACRNNQLQLAALMQIHDIVDRVMVRYGAARVAVIIGSSTSGIAEGGAALRQRLQSGAFPEAFDYAQQEIGTPAEFLAKFLQTSGIAYTVSTACTSSTKAFASARALLRADIADAVIVGGSDSLCELTVSGFSALESVSRDRCAPFMAERDGINIGEGAALFVMTRDAGDFAESVRLRGVGESSDAHHISAPHPDGVGAETAMRAALCDAGLQAAAIGYINLHGTATRKNDEMEARAIARVFGAYTACSSTKSLTGHLLGAAGASEAAYCWLTLMHGQGRLPPQNCSGGYDGELPPIALLQSVCRASAAPAHVMSTNYAFGGSNAALIFSRY